MFPPVPPPLRERLRQLRSNPLSSSSSKSGSGRGLLKPCAEQPRSKQGDDSHYPFSKINTGSIRSRLRENPIQTQHYITMAEATTHVTHRTRNIVILPPKTRDKDIPSDDENLDEGEASGDIPEGAGEIELEEDESTTDEEENSPEAPLRWRKHARFLQPLGNAERLPPLEQTYPVLTTMTQYEMWKENFDEDIENLISQLCSMLNETNGLPKRICTTSNAQFQAKNGGGRSS